MRRGVPDGEEEDAGARGTWHGGLEVRVKESIEGVVFQKVFSRESFWGNLRLCAASMQHFADQLFGTNTTEIVMRPQLETWLNTAFNVDILYVDIIGQYILGHAEPSSSLGCSMLFMCLLCWQSVSSPTSSVILVVQSFKTHEV